MEILTYEHLQNLMHENPFLKLKDAVAEMLESSIISSELVPGEKINLNKVSTELKISVTPVHEAVELLVEQGLITKDRSENGRFSYVTTKMSKKMISDLFDARAIIECAGAYYCAEKNWLVDFDKMKNLCVRFQDRMEKACQQDLSATGYVPPKKPANLDTEFHMMIIRASGNEYIVSMYESISNKLSFLSELTRWFLSEDTDITFSFKNLSRQHYAIYNAIKLGLPQLARSAMGDHIDFCKNTCLHNVNY